MFSRWFSGEVPPEMYCILSIILYVFLIVSYLKIKIAEHMIFRANTHGAYQNLWPGWLQWPKPIHNPNHVYRSTFLFPVSWHSLFRFAPGNHFLFLFRYDHLLKKPNKTSIIP